MKEQGASGGREAKKGRAQSGREYGEVVKGMAAAKGGAEMRVK